MSFILTEKKKHVAVITINRPKSLNALNTEVMNELYESFRKVQDDEEVRVIIITGEGRAFVAGADIGEMAELNVIEGRNFGKTGQKVFREIEMSEKPTIAAVNGFALGGGLELALACDIRIASDKAVFGQPEVGLGITPGFSGTQRLAEVAGKAKAIEMIVTAENIKAEQAFDFGIVNRVVPADDLMKEAEALAEKIASNAPIAVRWANSAIKRGLSVDIDSGISIEADLFGMCFSTKDQKEGMKAFLEGRKAEFEGK